MIDQVLNEPYRTVQMPKNQDSQYSMLYHISDTHPTPTPPPKRTPCPSLQRTTIPSRRLFKPTLIFILTFLWPEDLSLLHGPNHHAHNPKPHKDQNRSHYTTDDLYWFAIECFAHGECGRYEGCVGKYIGEPCHGEGDVVFFVVWD